MISVSQRTSFHAIPSSYAIFRHCSHCSTTHRSHAGRAVLQGENSHRKARSRLSLCPSRKVELVHGLLRHQTALYLPWVVPEKARTALNKVLGESTLGFASVADTTGAVAAGQISPASLVVPQPRNLFEDQCSWHAMICDFERLLAERLASQSALHRDHHRQPRRRFHSYLLLGQ